MFDFTHANLSDQVLQSVDYWSEKLDPLICKKKAKALKAQNYLKKSICVINRSGEI